MTIFLVVIKNIKPDDMASFFKHCEDSITEKVIISNAHYSTECYNKTVEI